VLKQSTRLVLLGVIGVCAALVALLAFRWGDDDARRGLEALAQPPISGQRASAPPRMSLSQSQSSAVERQPETSAPVTLNGALAATAVAAVGNRAAVARQEPAALDHRPAEDPNEANAEDQRDPGADDDGSVPYCWVAISNLPEMYYAAARDRREVWSGDSSARFFALDDRAQHGLLQQTVDARAFAGKRLEFSAFIRTEAAVSGVKVWLIAVNSQGLIVAESGSDWLKGTLDWHSRAIVADIPADAAAITFALRMLGRGTLWVDDARIANAADGGSGGPVAAGAVSPNRGFWPSPSATLPTAPQNLDFETWGSGGACSDSQTE
jgi:hypothetical protein